MKFLLWENNHELSREVCGKKVDNHAKYYITFTLV